MADEGHRGGTLYTGPSHLVRVRHAIRTHQIPPWPQATFRCGGGWPLWAPRFYHEDFSTYDRSVIIAGDFRFGNGILADLARIDLEDPGNAWMTANNIRKEFISPEHDRYMLEFALEHLDRLVARTEGRLLVVFWDLLGREVKNRLAGRYFEAGRYRHPTWNLKEVEERYAGHAAGLHSVVEEADMASLYVDENCHPSFKGYCFMTAVAHGMHPAQALQKTRTIDARYRDAYFQGAAPCVLFGNSSFIAFIHTYLRDGSITLPAGWRVAVDENEVLDALELGIKVVEVSPFRFRDASGPERWELNFQRMQSRQRKYSRYANYRVLFWDAWVQEVLGQREARYAHLRPDQARYGYKATEDSFEASVKLSMIEELEAGGCVELNVKKNPTQKFIYLLQRLLDNGLLVEQDFKNYRARLPGLFA